jgi:hypothetical protein
VSDPGFEALLKWVESAIDVDDCERQIMSRGVGEKSRPFLVMHERRGDLRYEYVLTPEESRTRVCVDHAAARIDLELRTAKDSRP